jgi:toxin ParE1/3/4
MLIKKTEFADADLIDIYLYGATNFGQPVAESYFSSITQTFQFLAENPFAAMERAEFKPPVRIHPHNKHLIIYKVENDFILIIRVLHQKMDIRHYL